MLEDEADSVLRPDFAVIADVPAPEPDVVDNARFRLVSRYPESGAHQAGEMPAHPMDDARAVRAVIDAVRSAAEPPAHALDVGAGLVLVGHLHPGPGGADASPGPACAAGASLKRTAPGDSV